MNEEKTQEIKKRIRHEDRITLDQEAMDRVKAWMQSLTEARYGIVITRKDLVNWVIKSRDIVLSSEEIAELTNRYFDKVRFLKAAIEEVKRANAKGIDVRLETMLAGVGDAAKPRPKRLKKAKEVQTAAPIDSAHPKSRESSQEEEVPNAK